MSLPFTSLDAATSVGAGAVRDLEGSVRYHTMFVTVTGTPTNVAVLLEGSHDGGTWQHLGNVQAGSGSITRTEALVRYVRANLTTLTGGTSPTVTATIASEQEN